MRPLNNNKILPIPWGRSSVVDMSWSKPLGSIPSCGRPWESHLISLPEVVEQCLEQHLVHTRQVLNKYQGQSSLTPRVPGKEFV